MMDKLDLTKAARAYVAWLDDESPYTGDGETGDRLEEQLRQALADPDEKSLEEQLRAVLGPPEKIPDLVEEVKRLRTMARECIILTAIAMMRPELKPSLDEIQVARDAGLALFPLLPGEELPRK